MPAVLPESNKFENSFELSETDPVTERCGKRSAAATPIAALCAATRRSAARTSGRRLSRLAGIPTTRSAGKSGMEPSPSSSLKSRGGIPSNTQRLLLAARTWFSNSGISCCVLASTVSACVESS